MLLSLPSGVVVLVIAVDLVVVMLKSPIPLFSFVFFVVVVVVIAEEAVEAILTVNEVDSSDPPSPFSDSDLHIAILWRRFCSVSISISDCFRGLEWIWGLGNTSSTEDRS